MTGLQAAADALEAGGVAVFPTETVWGIGARLDRPWAVRRIVEIKGRDPDKPLQVLLPDTDSLARVAELPLGAEDLAAAFMPGPLTMVLPARPGLPDLGGGETVGVRVPAHDTALELLARTGPLAASSANRAGRPTPATLEGVREVFADEVDAYVDGPCPAGVPSTVLWLAAGAPRILRAGAADPIEIEAILGGRLAR